MRLRLGVGNKFTISIVRYRLTVLMISAHMCVSVCVCVCAYIYRKYYFSRAACLIK